MPIRGTRSFSSALHHVQYLPCNISPHTHNMRGKTALTFGRVGACQRSGPTGGAAYGIPRNLLRVGVTSPCTRPESVCTHHTYTTVARVGERCGRATADVLKQIRRDFVRRIRGGHERREDTNATLTLRTALCTPERCWDQRQRHTGPRARGSASAASPKSHFSARIVCVQGWLLRCVQVWCWCECLRVWLRETANSSSLRSSPSSAEYTAWWFSMTHSFLSAKACGGMRRHDVAELAAETKSLVHWHAPVSQPGTMSELPNRIRALPNAGR